MSLLDNIRKNMGQAGQQSAQPNMQRDMQQTIQAKSGKAVSSSGPLLSSIQQRAAQDQTRAGLQQVAAQGQIQSQALGLEQAGQQQQFGQTKQDMIQQVKFQRDELSRQTTAILNDVERNQAQMDQAQKAANLEQAGFLIGLQNDQYLAELDRAGKLRRLDNDITFKEELQKSALEDDWALYQDDIEFRKLLDMDEAEFRVAMKDMELSEAMEIFTRAQKTKAMQGLFQGLGQAGGAAASSRSSGQKTVDTTESGNVSTSQPGSSYDSSGNDTWNYS